MNANLIVGGVETFSTVDFPGHMAAVVFLQGCPWRCPFCYNTPLQKIGAETNFVWSKFVEFLERRKGILDAVVFSGGEPLVQDNLAQAMSQVRDMGYKIALHTGGYRPEKLAEVLPLVDWVGFDIKTPFVEEHYHQGTGSKTPLKNILSSLDLLLAAGKPFECRTTCDPRLLDIEDIYAIARDLKAKGVKEYHLQKYRPIPSDKVSTEADCDKFFRDNTLHDFLKSSFEVFDLRS